MNENKSKNITMASTFMKEEVKLCRICLNSGIKLHSIEHYNLKSYYEEITSERVRNDGLPQYVCYECATLLQKFHKFKEKCYNGLQLLKDILWKGPITYKVIEKINRFELSLQSPLRIDKTNIYYYFDQKNGSEGEAFLTNEEINLNTTEEPVDGTKKEELYDSEDDLPLNINQERLVKIVRGEEGTNVIEVKEFNPLGSPMPIDDDMNSNDDGNNVAFDDIVIDERKSNKIRKKSKKSVEKKSKKVSTKKDKTKNLVVVKKTTSKEKKDGRRSDMPKVRALYNENNWRVVNLLEEEAMKEFKEKAMDKNYTKFTYKCEECMQGFSKKEILNRHKIRAHNEAFTNTCKFCKSRFRVPCKLKQHMAKHYTKYHCLRCDFTALQEMSAIFHDEFHSGVIRKCKECGEEYRHSSSYYTHIRTAHRSGFICTLCGLSFVSQVGLKMHMKRKHCTVREDEETVPEKQALYEPSDSYCATCDIQFETREAYDQHFLKSAKHDDGNAPKPEYVSLPKRRVRKAGLRPSTCHQCGKHFKSQKGYMDHHRAEHPRTSLYSPEQRHVCPICGISLAPCSVNSHINMHTKETQFACDLCGRKFLASISLKRHLMTHTGEKPYACSLCDKRFTQKGSMQLHYRTAHLKQPYPKRNRRTKDEPTIPIDMF